MFKLAIICGGPSLERGISLNSARSLLDHLASEEIEIIPLYVDLDRNFYAISCAQLYSNTPADFDFKLGHTAAKLDAVSLKHLLKSVDLVFPVIHGPFGEDGELQAILEAMGVPFVGSASAHCRQFFHKYHASQLLKRYGYQTLPSVLLKPGLNNAALIEQFFKTNQLEKAIIKPAVGGSSIGVSLVRSPEQALHKCEELFHQGIYTEAILEFFCTGIEFTVLVLDSLEGDPVALIPTEIEKEESHHQLFDYRKKYLPTNQVTYHTPPRFTLEVIQDIRSQAEVIFRLFNMRDFVRMDGWLMPDQSLYFTDLNPISGLEQNSFFFRQAALLGMTHQEVLHHLLHRACLRYEIPFPKQNTLLEHEMRDPVYVLFGGTNAERQVSLMSGTNVWLKLRRSKQFNPSPFLYDLQGKIWELPYCYTLNHTVEEVYQNCLSTKHPQPIQHLMHTIQEKLQVKDRHLYTPHEMTQEEFIFQAQKNNAFVFIAMHGGVGEDGTLQNRLEQAGVLFNGSNARTSALCMDKYATATIINHLGDPTLISSPKITINAEMIENYRSNECLQLWNEMQKQFETKLLLVKPRGDGCSAGIALLHNAQDLERYIALIRQKSPCIPMGTFPNQKGIIEMPSHITDYIIEPYIETDLISIEQNCLKHSPKKGWIELTVGVLENNGSYQALSPSITIAEGAVLSLEEKFQGGTGVNLTPPPESIMTPQATETIKRQIEKCAKALDIRNYSRIDIFFNLQTEQVIVIEANTLPGLTPSTVIYHQGLAEKVPLNPLALLEKIICLKKLVDISC